MSLALLACLCACDAKLESVNADASLDAAWDAKLENASADASLDARYRDAEPDAPIPPIGDFINTFDNADWLTKFSAEEIGHSANFSQIAAPGGRPGSAMRIYCQANPTSGNNDGFVGWGGHIYTPFSALGLNYGGQEGGAEEITVEYDLWLPSNWNPYEGGKLPGIGGREPGVPAYEVSGGGSYEETTWSGRIMWKKPADGNLDHGRLMTYLYVAALGSQTIESNVNPNNGIRLCPSEPSAGSAAVASRTKSTNLTALEEASSVPRDRATFVHETPRYAPAQRANRPLD